jgi:hypothetical protein
VRVERSFLRGGHLGGAKFSNSDFWFILTGYFQADAVNRGFVTCSQAQLISVEARHDLSVGVDAHTPLCPAGVELRCRGKF